MEDILDLYFQIGVDVWLSNNRPELAHRAAPEDLAGWKQRLADGGLRLRGAGIVPFPSAEDPGYRQANAVVEDFARRGGPDGLTLAPFYAVVPGDGGAAARLRAVLDQGAPCLGIKLWPYMGRFSLPALLEDRPLLDLVRERHLIVAS